MAKKVALLVGINEYYNGSEPDSKGRRHHTNGNPVTLQPLRGCVNDVKLMVDLLEKFNFDTLTLLTSPRLPNAISPTSQNILKKLNEILSNSNDGDIFFFHFSGHGGRLPTTKKDPFHKRTLDPSLLPVDYCCQGSPLRGWELNRILHKFHKKHVHVVVSMDSCHSGGSYRGDSTTRSPENWKEPPPNLPSDEATEEVPPEDPGYRHAKLETTWDINPDNLVVMTACRAHQKAAETKRGGGHGVFTYELYQYLARNTSNRRPMYRDIRDHIGSTMPPEQTPTVFGQDRLVFLETKETFLAATVTATVHGRRAELPIGKVHGVNVGAVLTSRWGKPNALLTITKVDDLTSEGDLDVESTDARDFVPFRWCAEKPTKVLVDKALNQKFFQALEKGLQVRIASKIKVEQGSSQPPAGAAGVVQFQLQTTSDDGIDITCLDSPRYEGLAWCLDTRGKRVEEQAIQSADSLAHLLRFNQLYALRDKISPDNAKFTVALDSKGRPEKPLAEGSKIGYTFKNNDDCDLYFTVLNFGPGFHIEQIFPKQDGPKHASPDDTRTCKIDIDFPRKLQRASANSKKRVYREVIRTVVTRDEEISLKSIELPDIWNANAMQCGGRGRSAKGEGAKRANVSSDFAWWIEDIVIWTTPNVIES